MIPRAGSALRGLVVSAAMLAASLQVAAAAGPATTAQPIAVHAADHPHCVVEITRFAFNHPLAHGGDPVKLFLVIRNCTDRTIPITITEFGRMIPPCPTIDPIGSSTTLAPNQRYVPSPLKILVPSCNGVESMVAEVSSNGSLLAWATTTLHIRTP
ncbi:MAG TPA: hypothetical protein VGH10_10385 [Actinomycetota bacterium]|jgi:hypothetical protein